MMRERRMRDGERMREKEKERRDLRLCRMRSAVDNVAHGPALPLSRRRERRRLQTASERECV